MSKELEEELRRAGYGEKPKGLCLNIDLDEPKPLPANELRVIAVDDRVAGCIRIEIDNTPTQQARRILLRVLPTVLELFLQKNQDYSSKSGYSWAESLGDKAQFVDMWRKMTKLHRGLWEGEPLQGEPVEEILADLVGHILLALDARSTQDSAR